MFSPRLRQKLCRISTSQPRDCQAAIADRHALRRQGADLEDEEVEPITILGRAADVAL